MLIQLTARTRHYTHTDTCRWCMCVYAEVKVSICYIMRRLMTIANICFAWFSCCCEQVRVLSLLICTGPKSEFSSRRKKVVKCFSAMLTTGVWVYQLVYLLRANLLSVSAERFFYKLLTEACRSLTYKTRRRRCWYFHCCCCLLLLLVCVSCIFDWQLCSLQLASQATRQPGNSPQLSALLRLRLPLLLLLLLLLLVFLRSGLALCFISFHAISSL